MLIRILHRKLQVLNLIWVLCFGFGGLGIFYNQRIKGVIISVQYCGNKGTCGFDCICPGGGLRELVVLIVYVKEVDSAKIVN